MPGKKDKQSKEPKRTVETATPDDHDLMGDHDPTVLGSSSPKLTDVQKLR